MFESYTHEKILADALAAAPEGIDTRPGSIYYDAVNGISMRIAKYYGDLDLVREMATVMSATDDALDTKASEYGVTRRTATKAQYRAIFEGTTPAVGERFYYDLAYFVLKSEQGDDGPVLVFEAEQAGESGNEIYPGTPAVPVNSIEGLDVSTFGEIFERGSDREEDDNLRQRVLEKIAGPAENGNRQHYKTWCEERSGVGRARIFPLWYGENTVKAVLIDPTGKPAGEPTVADVQNYIDPCGKGMTVEVEGKTYNFGDGLGNGVANVGAHFTAVAATALEIEVTFTAELAAGADKEQVKEQAQEAIENYLRELVLTADEDTQIVVRISAIGALLAQLKTLTDYSELLLNGEESNITPGSDDVPVLKEVVVS